ncbi:MAG: aminopeptidase P family protein [Calditrichaeota bacterium]|nr:aminopeptidase P family protein [Calditrichota bacterium]
MPDPIVHEKIQQASEILKEKGIDAWLVFVRESAAMADPTLEMVLGTGCTWQSAFFITAAGDTIAIVGSLDAANIEGTGTYREIIGYTASIRDDLLKTLNKINPQKIAINYSKNDYMSDGLTHGMFLLLQDYLQGTPFINRLVSSESVVSSLRGRKSPTELKRIQEAIRITEEIYDKVTGFLHPGQSEKEIAAFIKNEFDAYGVEPAWDPIMCPSVFTGPETAGAHFGPTDRKTEKGHIINMDFGVKKDDYCSDMQRTWYFLRDGETKAPENVQKGFDVLRDSIQLAAKAIKPGMAGWEIDKVARDHIVQNGFEEYPHALGHQVGRLAHDGGGLLAPQWDRYGELPFQPIEVGQVYTLEPRLTVEGHGVVTMEEIIVVRENGAEFLSHPQTELWLIG